MKLNIYKETEIRLPRAKLQSLFDTVIRKEASRKWQGQVNIIFSHDTRLRSLNREYRRKDKTTDVLSFNIEDPTAAEAVFGEIYISIPTALKQAKAYEAPVSEELLRLACHGLLHLLGYDHHKANDERIMKMREERYLSKVIGV